MLCTYTKSCQTETEQASNPVIKCLLKMLFHGELMCNMLAFKHISCVVPAFQFEFCHLAFCLIADFFVCGEGS